MSETVKEVSNFLPTPKERDWHASRSDAEPRCSADQWRTKDRKVVTYFSEMVDRHLHHCIRFASTKPQHASRLAGLLAEAEARKATS
jgi:hypothetical protein